MDTIPQIEPKTQNSYQSQWTPGDKLPQRQADAWSALQRNAAAYDKYLHDEERKQLADRRAA
jgi:hypothetical protein